MLFPQCRLVLVLLFLLPSVFSVLVNVTIDDTFGDPLTGAHIDYTPTTSWILGGDCDGCSSVPDEGQAHFRTWHDGTFNKNVSSNSILLATVPFFGNAIYVYCILSLSSSSPPSDMTFFIDREQVGSFSALPIGQAGFQYNALVFSNTTLRNGNHTLIIQNGHSGGGKSLTLLDYIVYSYDDGTHPSANKTSGAMPSPDAISSPTATTSSNKSRVVGAVLGTLFALLFLVLVFVAYRRYRKGKPVVPPPGSFSRWFHRLGSSFRSSGGHKQGNSFNPQLLVQRFTRQSLVPHLPSERSPPPLPPKLPRPSFPSQFRHHSTELPYLSDPPATGEFHSARSSPAPLLAAAYGVTEQPHYPSGSSYSSKLESIYRWQRQTMEQTRGQKRGPPPDMSEQLSSYYDDNATESHRVKTPPPPPRRYTVVNN